LQLASKTVCSLSLLVMKNVGPLAGRYFFWNLRILDKNENEGSNNNTSIMIKPAFNESFRRGETTRSGNPMTRDLGKLCHAKIIQYYWVCEVSIPFKLQCIFLHIERLLHLLNFRTLNKRILPISCFGLKIFTLVERNFGLERKSNHWYRSEIEGYIYCTYFCKKWDLFPQLTHNIL
jgi:hypothetical protein